MRNTQLQVRRGTSNQWFCANPILLSGEPGLETDTLRYKIGDGTKAWNDLEYVSFDGGNMDQSVVQPGSFQSGSGSFIVLSDYFDPTKPMNSYKGVTGSKMTVPSGFDYAIYIDSNGNVTQESVTAGQQLTFKSDIVAGIKTPYNCGKMDCGEMTGYNPETCKCCPTFNAWDGSKCSCIITDEYCQSISIPEAKADPSTCSCTIECSDPPKCIGDQFLNENCKCECKLGNNPDFSFCAEDNWDLLDVAACECRCFEGRHREGSECVDCPAPNTPDCPCGYENGTDSNGCETISCKECYPKMMANFKSTIEW